MADDLPDAALPAAADYIRDVAAELEAKARAETQREAGGVTADVGQIKRGRTFLHRRQVTRSSTAATPVPELCVITRVAKDRVYYRNSTGFLSVTSLETFEADTVKEWLESEPEAD